MMAFSLVAGAAILVLLVVVVGLVVFAAHRSHDN